jgi:hypothetical protein
VSERLRWARRGVRGGGARLPLGGCRGAEPPARGFGGSAPEFFFFGPTYFSSGRADIFSSGQHISGMTYFRDDIFPGRHITGTTYFRDHMILGGFSAHGFLPMVFYFRLRN